MSLTSEARNSLYNCIIMQIRIIEFDAFRQDIKQPMLHAISGRTRASRLDIPTGMPAALIAVCGPI